MESSNEYELVRANAVEGLRMFLDKYALCLERGTCDMIKDIVRCLNNDNVPMAVIIWKTVRPDLESCFCDCETLMPRVIVVSVSVAIENVRLVTTQQRRAELVDFSMDSINEIVQRSQELPWTAPSAGNRPSGKSTTKRLVGLLVGIVSMLAGLGIGLAPAPRDAIQEIPKIALAAFFIIAGLVSVLTSLFASKRRIDDEFRKMFDRL